MPQLLMIGDLARRTGTKVNTIRFYEEIGLLPHPARTAAGRRTYGTEDVRRLAFVRHARALGFGTAVIRSLLELGSNPEQPCEGASEIARQHLTDVEQRIKQLKALKAELKRLLVGCGTGGCVANCRILEALGSELLSLNGAPVCSGPASDCARECS